jgi:hypothetical protein
MAAFGNRYRSEVRDFQLYADHRTRRKYATSFENASTMDFPSPYAEEAAIQSGRDYSTWILSAADCDLFMHALLNTPRGGPGSRISAHRHKRRNR